MTQNTLLESLDELWNTFAPLDAGGDVDAGSLLELKGKVSEFANQISDRGVEKLTPMEMDSARRAKGIFMLCDQFSAQVSSDGVSEEYFSTLFVDTLGADDHQILLDRFRN